MTSLQVPLDGVSVREDGVGLDSAKQEPPGAVTFVQRLAPGLATATSSPTGRSHRGGTRPTCRAPGTYRDRSRYVSVVGLLLEQPRPRLRACEGHPVLEWIGWLAGTVGLLGEAKRLLEGAVGEKAPDQEALDKSAFFGWTGTIGVAF